MALATEGFSAYILKNQIKSVILLAGFPFLLLVMMFGIFYGLGILSQPTFHPMHGQKIFSQQMPPLDFHHAFEYAIQGIREDGIFAFAAAGIWFVIAYFLQTRMIRASCGAKPVNRAQMPRIYNLLENLCISRGMAMPEFDVIDSPALNAFASGINESTYRITLTRGIIESLSDDELECVIAHELTHIRNSDVRLLMIAVIFVGMISFFSHMVWRMMVHGMRPNFYRRDSRNSGIFYLLILLLAFVILMIGYFFAIAIRFTLSRKREFLADAGAIELTKNPEGLMRALLRISGHDRVPGMPHQVQQMCIENSDNFLAMFSTHPTVEARLDAISRITGVEVPVPGVSLRRPPKAPWKDGVAPDAPPVKTTLPLKGAANPWGVLPGNSGPL